MATRRDPSASPSEFAPEAAGAPAERDGLRVGGIDYTAFDHLATLVAVVEPDGKCVFEVDANGDAALTAGRSRAIREEVQAVALARLAKELPVSPSFLPQLFEDAAQPKAIRELAKRLA